MESPRHASWRKCAFEIAANGDYLFGFAASTAAGPTIISDQLFASYLEDERVRDFMSNRQPVGAARTADRFAEAIRRGLWDPRRAPIAPPTLIAELLGPAQKEIA